MSLSRHYASNVNTSNQNSWCQTQIWLNLLGLRYAVMLIARDVKLMAASSGFLKSRILFYSYSKPFSRRKLCLHQHYIHQTHWIKGNWWEMARKQLLLKWSAFRYCPEKYKIKRKFTFFFSKYQNISSHVLKISSISLVLSTHGDADIFNTFDEIYLIFTSKK